ncbi:uncharacterized protein TRIADDRAFT_61538 [Trichoplax adhaerens]|uniref:Uncharacterized protein n=1 Tax=Trichoplax adhaerens TaxID=10228 RepID=B3SB97_TRIAD|nr:predicted protein [Trichoplax adhaerens]EDV19921.1 predicted protein [Trichoplax adhaerens]|eukprot:XP_002117511.1 predicted protein [Trichoplax adhaerens]
MESTRNCPIFGTPKELDNYVLPKIEDVVRFYDYIKTNGNKAKIVDIENGCQHDIIKYVAEQVAAAWILASIPIIPHKEVVERVSMYIKERQILVLVPNADQNNLIYQRKIDQFWNNSQKLFDICTCQCLSEMVCQHRNNQRVSKKRKDFLLDQRTDRKLTDDRIQYKNGKVMRPGEIRKRRNVSNEIMCILSSNFEQLRQSASEKNDRKSYKSDSCYTDCVKRKGYHLRRHAARRQAKLIKLHKKLLNSDSENYQANEKKLNPDFLGSSDVSSKGGMKIDDSDVNASEDTWHPSPKGKLGANKLRASPFAGAVIVNQLRIPLPALARECERYNISDRKGAAIATAVLQDFNIVNEKNLSGVIDSSKLRRERKKYRDSIVVSNFALSNLYFDGKRDKCIANIQMGKKRYRREKIEEHITMLSEPNHEYIGHVTPVQGSSKYIVDAMIDFFQSNRIFIDGLQVIGCDGTNVNIGPKGGVIRLLEERLNKPIHWFVCLLHLNELPFRRLFQQLDAVNEEVGLYTGPIGKSIFNTPFNANLSSTDGISFQKLKCDLPEFKSIEELSCDQKYLYQICTAISKGYCEIDLSRRYPGNISNARWLTTANRILRVYIATSTPSKSLQIITNYIIKVYTPLWFAIKAKPQCTYGPRHFFQLIRLSRFLASNQQKIIDEVIQRNAYFAHPENLLLAMLTDDDKSLRESAFEKILFARRYIKRINVRQFKIPKIDFNAASYAEMIDWQREAITEPPLTMPLSELELRQIVETGDDSHFDAYPCHMQAVERIIRLVTAASTSVYGYERREGLIRSTLKSRKITKGSRKADFKCR